MLLADPPAVSVRRPLFGSSPREITKNKPFNGDLIQHLEPLDVSLDGCVHRAASDSTDGGAPGISASVVAGGAQQAGAGQLPSAESGADESRRGGRGETAEDAERAAEPGRQDERVRATTQRQTDPTGP